MSEQCPAPKRGRGRPRKDGERSPCGKLRPPLPAKTIAEPKIAAADPTERLTRAQALSGQQAIFDALTPSERLDIIRQQEAAAAKGEAEMAATNRAVVLMQPHRKGNADAMAESPLGRFCIEMKLPGTVYAAGCDYAALYGKWRAAWGVPRGAGTPGDTPSGTGEGPTLEAAKMWERRIKEIEHAISDAYGTEVSQLIKQICVDELQVLGITSDLVKRGLIMLAVITGHITSDQETELQCASKNSSRPIDIAISECYLKKQPELRS